MKLLKWLFDGPRIRSQLIKKLNELNHEIPGMESLIEYHKAKLDMRTSEYLAGRLYEAERQRDNIKEVLEFQSKI